MTTTRKVDIDCIFSIGKACRPSHYLREYNLRFQAAPLDWMMSYSLNTVQHLFETKFIDFFEEIEEIPDKYCGNHKFVKDTKNGITSIHHFPKDIELKVEQEKFRNMMLDRAENLNRILSNSSSIGFICDREDASTLDLINFVKKIDQIYPNKQITLINVVNADVLEFHKSDLFESENFKIIQFVFKDVPPVEDEKKFPKWKGNPEAWKLVMDCIKVNEKNLKDGDSVEF